MSNMIYKFNQQGVAQDIQLGKKGGHVKWNPAAERFELQNSGNANAVYISPLSASEYSATNSSRIEDNNLVTAGYVKSLIEGMRTKKSVQCATDGVNIEEKFFSKKLSTIVYDKTDGIHQNVLADAAMRELFGFDNPDSGYVPTNPANPKDAAYSRLRAVWTAGTRILLKNQTHAWQNGIYVFTVGESNLYLKRADDMDVEDEVEGAYVFVEQGTLESTGWVGNVPGSPESILDMRAPVLKSIEFDETTGISTNYSTVDGTAGYTKITFDQFHGQGTYRGDDQRGIKINGNKIGLDFSAMPDISGNTAVLANIVDTGTIAIEIDETGTKRFVTRNLDDMLEKDFRLHPHMIRDNRAPTDAGFEVKVASEKGQVGTAITFSVPTVNAKPGYIARPNLLTATVDEFKVDFGGNVSGTLSTGVDKGANITMIAGGTDSSTGAGGDIVLRAGNAGSAAAGASAGHIVLSGGFKNTAHQGTVKIEGAALNLPVGDNAARPVNGSADLEGAIRLNSEIESGIHTLEYHNKTEWVQVDGASYFIHDKINYGAGETAFDTYISTMGEGFNADGKIGPDPTNVLTFVSKNQKVMKARYDYVNITPAGPVTIAPVASDLSGDVFITTPVANAGSTTAANTGIVSIKTGSNTTSTTSGSQSGKILLETGDHQYRSGDIEINTGDVTGAGAAIANPTVGSLYLSTGKPDVTGSTVGTVFIGVSKAAATDSAYADASVHYKNNVVIGDAGYTQNTTIKSDVISIGESKGTRVIIGKRDATTPANSSGNVSVYGQDVVISADDADDVGNTHAVKINGRNIEVGTENTTTNMSIGHIADAVASKPGSTVDVRGSTVTVTTDNTLVLKSTKESGNIVFETKVKNNGGGSYTGGVLTVTDPDYHNSCVLPEAIPNVRYVQNVIKEGKFGPGNRTLQVTKAAAPANQYAFQIGENLPANAKITRVSITVNTGFTWADAGHGAAIKLAASRADAQTGGTTVMSEMESDIEFAVSAGDTQTYMSEFGAGIDAASTGVWIVFNKDYTPESATKGDIRVLVEFVAIEQKLANT